MQDTPKAKELTILEQIVVRKRAELVAQRALVSEADLRKRRVPERRGFRDALAAKAPAVISEIKKASPSAGVIQPDFDPATIATRYQTAGAACLSVLTDVQFFQGSLDDLVTARSSVRLPVLRKDFTLDSYHLLEASVHGADCILLIVAALEDGELRELYDEAKSLELDVLVEVHDAEELDRAVHLGADMIGVNNRNLKTLEVSLETSFELAERIPDNVMAVSESGIRTPEDVARLRDAGYRAFLIGESLMKQDDPGAALRTLLGG